VFPEYKARNKQVSQNEIIIRIFSGIRFTDDQMNDEIDRIRKENGWKPRKRGKPGRRGRGSGSTNGSEAANNTAAADEHVKLLQKLQVRGEDKYVFHLKYLRVRKMFSIYYKAAIRIRLRILPLN